jgi:hypothetical protein
MQSGVFFFPHVVIVHHHALLRDPTLDIFVLFTSYKQIVRIVLSVHLKEILSIGFPWLSNVMAEWLTRVRVCFHPWQLGRRWLSLRVCDLFKVFEVRKRVHVFDRIFVGVEITMLSRFNASGRAANSQILLKVFRMMYFDKFKSPAV